MKHLPLLAVALSLVLAQACSFTKDLERHHAQLLSAVGPDVPLSQKRDALGQSTVGMMHEAVDRLNPKKGAQYVRAYAKTNGTLLDTLVAQIARGQNAMSRQEKVAFMLGGATESYVRDAVALLPRFVAKYKQVQAVSRITGGLKEVLLGKASEKILGGLGDVSGHGCDDLHRSDLRHTPLHGERERHVEARPGALAR